MEGYAWRYHKGMSAPVGTAWIWIRADGHMLSRDIKVIAKDAGDQLGDETAEHYVKAFARSRKQHARSSAEAEIRALAQATNNADFSMYQKKFGGVRDTILGIRKLVDELDFSGRLDFKEIDAINEALGKWEKNNFFDSLNKDSRDFRNGEVRRLRAAMAAAVGGDKSKLHGMLKKAGGDVDVLIAKLKKLRPDIPFDAFDKMADDIRDMTRDEKSFFDKMTDDTKKFRVGELERLRIALAEAAAGDNTKFEAMFKKAGRDVDVFVEKVDKLRGTVGATDTDFDRMNARIRDLAHSEGKFIDQMDEDVKRFRLGELQRLRIALAEAHEGNPVKFTKMYNDAGKDVEKLTAKLRIFNDQQVITNHDIDVATSRIRLYSAEIKNADSRWHRLNRQIDRGGAVIGKAFGKGSRNNFLNFIGSVAENATKLGKIFPSFFNGIGNFFKAFKIGFGESGGGFATKSIAGLRGALGSLVTSVGPVVIGLTAVFVAASALASILSMLAAGVTVLAGALSYALAGALLPWVPALAAAVSGVGLLVAAFTLGTTKGNKFRDQFKKQIADIKKSLSGLRQAAEPIVAGIMEQLAKGTSKFATIMTPGITRALGSIRNVMKDPKNASLFTTWAESMSRMTGSLGTAFSHLGVALLAFFKPILPFAEKMTTAIEKAILSFERWAKSAKGQNEIRGFFEKAWKAAKDLGASLVNIGVALGNIFSISQDGAGKDFLGWLRDATERFKEWTASWEGQQAIKQWFTDAEGFFKSLKLVLSEIGTAFDNLDTTASREGVSEAFKNIASAVSALGVALEALKPVFAAVGLAFVGVAASITAGVAVILYAFKYLLVSVLGFVEGMLTAWGLLPDFLGGGKARAGAAKLKTYREGIEETFDGLIDKTKEYMGTLSDLEQALTGGKPTEPKPIKIDDKAARSAVYEFNKKWKELRDSPPANLKINAETRTGMATLQAWKSSVDRLPENQGLKVDADTTPSEGKLRSYQGWVAKLKLDRESKIDADPQPARNKLNTWSKELENKDLSKLSVIDGSTGKANAVVRAYKTYLDTTVWNKTSFIDANADQAYGELYGFLNTIPKSRTINIHTAYYSSGKPVMRASGGILTRATNVIAGEAGPEAIVPLRRPLHMVDPSVRALSGMLQGLIPMQSSPSPGNSTTIQPGAVTVVTQATDARRVAEMVEDRVLSALRGVR